MAIMIDLFIFTFPFRKHILSSYTFTSRFSIILYLLTLLYSLIVACRQIVILDTLSINVHDRGVFPYIIVLPKNASK